MNLRKKLQTGFISLLFLLVSCDLCYYCEELAFNFKPEQLDVEQEDQKVIISHFVSGIIEGSVDESPEGTKFKLEYYWSESDKDYKSGTKITSAKGGAVTANYNGRFWYYDKMPTTQMPSEFEYVPNKTDEREMYISSFDLPSGLDNGTYYVHVVAKCSCEGEEGTAYTNLGVITTIDLRVRSLLVVPFSSVSDFPAGDPLTSAKQNESVWVYVNLEHTPSSTQEIIMDLNGSITSTFGNVTILSGNDGTLDDGVWRKVNYYGSNGRSSGQFIFPLVLTKSDYDPGVYDLSFTVNQTSYNELNLANNTRTLSFEVLENSRVLFSENFGSSFKIDKWDVRDDTQWREIYYDTYYSRWIYSEYWERSTEGPTGYNSKSMGKIQSTSANDGFVLFDKDRLYNGPNSASSFVEGYAHLRAPLIQDFSPDDSTITVEFDYYFAYVNQEWLQVRILGFNEDKSFDRYSDVSIFWPNNLPDFSQNPLKAKVDLTETIANWDTYPYYGIEIIYYGQYRNGRALMIDDFKVKTWKKGEQPSSSDNGWLNSSSPSLSTEAPLPPR